MKAFPTPTFSINDEARVTAVGGEGGMDLRDYFAAKAMHGLISCPHWREEAGEDLDIDASKFTAISAYEMADAMMRARQS